MIGLRQLSESGRLADRVMEMMLPSHVPVMVNEVLDFMSLQPGQTVVDATIGQAGHSLRFMEAISPGGTLVGFDWDKEMLAYATRRIAAEGASGVQLEMIHADYREIGAVLERLQLFADAIFMDLGLNSAQLEDPERGIAFKSEGPLDMRMNRSAGEPASALLNRLSPDELEALIFSLGDERWARAIAKKIVERRKIAPLRTTTDLVDAVLAAIPSGARDKRIHPATRTFQAIRIAINKELEGLEDAIRGAAERLAPGGTLLVLSYHSGEDRAAKTTFRELAEEGFDELLRKPQQASAEEIQRIPRSRSAKLRAIRRHTP